MKEETSMKKKMGLCCCIAIVLALVFCLGKYLSAQPMPVTPQPTIVGQQLVVADLDNDKKKEIIVLDAGRVVVFDHNGKYEFQSSLPSR
jgi:hypothetical protein